MKFDKNPYDQWKSLKTKDPVSYKDFDSLFEFCKATSLYHFDDQRDDSNCIPPTYIPICNFVGDWDKDVKELMNQTEPATFDYRANPRRDNNNNMEYNDFKKWGYNVDGGDNQYVVLNRSKHLDLPDSLYKIIDLFKFKHPGGRRGGPNIKFDVQLPGQMFYWHLDNFGGLLRDQRDDYNKFAECDYDQRKLMRAIVFLDDQKQGQVWKQGNEFLTWKKGDCMTWPWRDIPHGTCNFGHEPRPTLNITGAMSPESWDFLRTCQKIIQI
jgi:hypothetical protein